MPERLYYLGAFLFPEGGPNAARALGTGKAIRGAGYEVVFGSDIERERTEDLHLDGKYYYQGMRYKAFAESRSLRRHPLGYFSRFLSSGCRALQWLGQEDVENPKAIIVSTHYTSSIKKLLRYCRFLGIPLIVDVVDWFEPSHCFLGPYGPDRINIELFIRQMVPRAGHVIAISSYLARYFRDRGCHVIRIPPLVDFNEPKWQRMNPSEGGPLRLLYAGAPGKKDIIDNAMHGVLQLRAEGYPVIIEVVGPACEFGKPRSAYYRTLLKQLGEGAVYHGPVSHRRTLELIGQADFTILLREDKRYANAGFPTKLVESVTSGVPIISNATSDIAEYIRDGQEGVILENESTEAFVAGVRRILHMPRERWRSMRVAALKRAEECFDYRQYVSPLREFIEEAVDDAMRQDART